MKQHNAPRESGYTSPSSYHKTRLQLTNPLTLICTLNALLNLQKILPLRGKNVFQEVGSMIQTLSQKSSPQVSDRPRDEALYFTSYSYRIFLRPRWIELLRKLLLKILDALPTTTGNFEFHPFQDRKIGFSEKKTFKQ